MSFLVSVETISVISCGFYREALDYELSGDYGKAFAVYYDLRQGYSGKREGEGELMSDKRQPPNPSDRADCLVHWLSSCVTKSTSRGLSWLIKPFRTPLRFNTMAVSPGLEPGRWTFFFCTHMADLIFRVPSVAAWDHPTSPRFSPFICIVHRVRHSPSSPIARILATHAFALSAAVEKTNHIDSAGI